MNKRLVKNCLATVLLLMVAVITFFTWNLIFSLVSNYEALSMTSISSLPMVFFMIILYVLIFAVFDYEVLKRKDAYFFRKFSIIVASFALLGMISSILDGTIVYHTFVGDYVFFAMPLFMLIVHALICGIAVYGAVLSCKSIHDNKPEKTWERPKLYWIREVLMALLLMFALEKFGAFLLLPVFWSSYDSIYVLPFYIQLLIPSFIVVMYFVDRHWLHNKKLNIILSGSALAYSLFSLIYMLLMSKGTWPLVINPLSPILQLERLITKPIGAIVLYAVSLIYPCVILVLNVVKLLKEKKEAK